MHITIQLKVIINTLATTIYQIRHIERFKKQKVKTITFLRRWMKQLSGDMFSMTLFPFPWTKISCNYNTRVKALCFLFFGISYFSEKSQNIVRKNIEKVVIQLYQRIFCWDRIFRYQKFKYFIEGAILAK